MTTTHTTPKADCPKRVWVLQALSDDDAQGVELPQGLRFHLGRCAECRELADRLGAASASIASLAALAAPSADFAATARARVVSALENGAVLTGRVTIPDEPPAAAPQRTWRLYTALAAAAAVALAATAWVLDSGGPALTGPGNPVVHLGPSAHGDSPAPESHTAPQATDAAEAAIASSIPHPVRRYSNPVDAAFANDDGSVQAAFTLPPPRSGGLTALIDRMRGEGSTDRNPPPQKP